MNSFIESLNLWGARFLEFVVPMLFQSSLLIALIFVLDFALRRKVRAAVRYALWFVVLLKLLLPPTLALPTGAAWWLRSAEATAPVPKRILTVSYPEAAVDIPQPAITIPTPPPPPPSLSAAAWMLLASTAGSLFLLTWLLARWRQITRQICASSPAPPQIVELFNQITYEARSRSHGSRSSRRESAPSSPHELSQRWIESPITEPPTNSPKEFLLPEGEGQDEGEPRSMTKRSVISHQRPITLFRWFRQAAQIRIVPAPISPAVCGLFRPVILLPESLVKQLSPAQLRAVLLHELIHLRRRDVWMNCFQTFLQIAYWWHPLLWLANARVRRLREESVDDAVMLALNENSEVYAPTLLEVAKLAFNRPLASLGLVGILESKNALRQRIERLMNFTTPRRAGLSLVSVLCIAAFTAVAVPMGEAPARLSDPDAGLDSTNLILYHTKVDPEVFIRNIKARASETMHTTNDPWGDILLSILDGYGIKCTPPCGLALNKQTGELTTQNTPEALQVLDQVINELNLPGGERILNPPYGLKQVLIEAYFYRMQPEQFAQIDLDSAYRNRDRNSSPSWQLTSNQVNQVTQSIKQLGLRPISRPRIQTSHGIAATLNIGDKTNDIELQCVPYIRDGAVELTVLARTTGTYAPPGGWPDFAGRTNCAIFSRVGFEDGGGAVLQAQAADAAPQNNLVVLLRARTIQHSPTPASRRANIRTSENSNPTNPNYLRRTNVIYVSPQRQKIYSKLTSLTFDRIGFPTQSLDEVVSNLTEMVKQLDPSHEGINFSINQSLGTDEATKLAETMIFLDPPLEHVKLMDVLEAIVMTADHPLKYSISDQGIEFSSRGHEEPELFSRTFKINPKDVRANFRWFEIPDQSSIQNALLEIFEKQGISLSPPESFFLNEKQDTLTVHATSNDLDEIEALVNVLVSRAVLASNDSSAAGRTAYSSPGREKMLEKLNNIVFDEISFPNMSLDAVVKVLWEQAKHHDPDHTGISFILSNATTNNSLGGVKINLQPKIKNVRLHDVLDAIVKSADQPIQYSVLYSGVEFSSQSEKDNPVLFTESLKIEGQRLTLARLHTIIDLTADPVSIQKALLDAFGRAGISFAPPKFLSFNDQQGTLIIHATLDDIDRIQELLDQANRQKPFLLTSDTHSSQSSEADEPEVSHTDLSALVQDGKLLFQRGKLDEAEAKFHEVLHSEPDNQAALYYLAVINQERTKNASESPSSNLESRIFKLDPNTFYLNLYKTAGIPPSRGFTAAAQGGIRPHVVATGPEPPKSEIETAIMSYFRAAGVDLSPPKSLIFDDHHSALTVHATARDLELIQAAVNTLGVAPPEVNVKARFVEVAATRDSSGRIRPVANAFTDFMKNVLTNKSDSADFVSGILSEAQMKSALKLFDENTNMAPVAEGQVTTLSGRQAQFFNVDVSTVVNGLKVSVTNNQTSYNYQTTNMNFGHVLDVLPEILSDQRAVSLKLIPTVTEFLGYADPKEISKYDKNLQHAQLPLPKYRRWSVTTTAIVPDGQTLVLANLGDEILVGTAPSYKAKPVKNSAKQLLVFITPTLIDRAGNRLYAKSSKDYYDYYKDYLRALRSNDYYDTGFGGFGGFGGGGFGGFGGR